MSNIVRPVYYSMKMYLFITLQKCDFCKMMPVRNLSQKLEMRCIPFVRLKLIINTKYILSTPRSTLQYKIYFKKLRYIRHLIFLLNFILQGVEPGRGFWSESQRLYAASSNGHLVELDRPHTGSSVESGRTRNDDRMTGA